MIIDDRVSLERFLSFQTVLLYPIYTNDHVHSSVAEVAAVFVSDLSTKQTAICPINHSESLDMITLDEVLDVLSKRTVYVWDKKLFNKYPNTFHDLRLAFFLNNEELPASELFHNQYKLWRRVSDSNRIVPLALLYDTICSNLSKEADKLKKLTSFTISENDNVTVKYEQVLQTLYDIEKNGLKTRSGWEWSYYNIYNPTGRPSNRFNGINYAALSKKDDTRLNYISRFGDAGLLYLFDYQAFHPTIIANYLKVSRPMDKSLHRFLGEIYYDKNDLTDEEYEESKKKTFYHLYGTITDDLLDIEFFRKTKKLIDTFDTSDYIQTPLFNRRIDVEGFNPQKKFNYFLQAFESEINFLKLKQLNEYLADKKSKLILYIYDAFLVDYCKADGEAVITDIKKILEKGNFNITTQIGKNYKELK